MGTSGPPTTGRKRVETVARETHAVDGRGHGKFALTVFLGLVSVGFAGCLGGEDGKPQSDALGGGSLQQSQTDAPLLDGAGAIEGIVLNENGAPLLGAHITILTTPLYTESDKDGRFNFPEVTPGVYTLRTDRKDYESLEDAVTVSLEKVTDVTITLLAPGSSNVGFRDHLHDFWGDESTITLFSGTVGQRPLWTEGSGGQTPPFCVKAVGAVQLDYDRCYVLPFSLKDGMIVPPGTKELHVTVAWDKQDLVKKVDFGYSTANTSTIKYVSTAPGVVEVIPVAEKAPDHGHAKFSAWRFQLLQVAEPAPGVNFGNDQFNQRMLPTYKVTIHAVKGTIYPEAPHARFWEESGRLVLMERGFLNITGYPTPRTRDPTVIVCGTVQCFTLKDKYLVPPGTTKLEVTMEWSYGANCPASLFDQKSVAFRTGEGNPAKATLASLRVEEGQYSGSKVTYAFKVKDIETDAFYQKKSNWLFMVAHKGQERADKYQPDCPDAVFGGDHFFMHIEAVNENWAADRAAGKV